eukprot:TRINITY_DN20804_c0_g1_i1.p1 TRINITY_DN20804_c0_g1~~TRINITY_DN20804_c0_g1_i1.p1  ORF type:complete len:681 (-),score=262.78 TRINITY_DN20804_c0_g1_i1:50-2032(-)
MSVLLALLVVVVAGVGTARGEDELKECTVELRRFVLPQLSADHVRDEAVQSFRVALIRVHGSVAPANIRVRRFESLADGDDVYPEEAESMFDGLVRLECEKDQSFESFVHKAQQSNSAASVPAHLASVGQEHANVLLNLVTAYMGSQATDDAVMTFMLIVDAEFQTRSRKPHVVMSDPNRVLPTCELVFLDPDKQSFAPRGQFVDKSTGSRIGFGRHRLRLVSDDATGDQAQPSFKSTESDDTFVEAKKHAERLESAYQLASKYFFQHALRPEVVEQHHALQASRAAPVNRHNDGWRHPPEHIVENAKLLNASLPGFGVAHGAARSPEFINHTLAQFPRIPPTRESMSVLADHPIPLHIVDAARPDSYYCEVKRRRTSLSEPVTAHHDAAMVLLQTMKFEGMVMGAMEGITEPMIDPVAGGMVSSFGSRQAAVVGTDIEAGLTDNVPHELVAEIAPPLSSMFAPSIAETVTDLLPPLVATQVRDYLVVKLTSRITTGVSTRLARTLTKKVTARVAKHAPKELDAELQYDLGHILCKSITQSAVPAIIHTTSHSPLTDYYCYYCYHYQQYCAYCNYSPVQNYYGQIYAGYYSNYYCDYYASYFYKELKSRKAGCTKVTYDRFQAQLISHQFNDGSYQIVLMPEDVPHNKIVKGVTDAKKQS